MDKTFQIRTSTDPRVVGVYSQIQEFSRTYPVPMGLYFYQNESGRFEEDIQFPVYRMESKAKLTDLISNVPLVDNLMISLRALETFQKLSLPEFQVFPLKFIYKGSLNSGYCAFSIVKQQRSLEYISWKNSRFYKTTNWHKNILDEYTFNSMDDLMKTKKELETTEFGLKCDIKLTYQNEFDIINFGRYPMPIGFLCSEQAKELIVSSGLTGFAFEELPSDVFIGSH